MFSLKIHLEGLGVVGAAGFCPWLLLAKNHG
jgi:hypothetical protein